MSEQTTALATTPNNPIGVMLQAITANGITPESASALEKLTDLYLKVESVNARKAFIDAKAALQAELPPIHATRAVPNNDGTVRYRFAPYEEIMRAVAPVLVKHGFSISFSQEIGESRIVAVCTLSHVDGHSESNSFAVRAGQGPPKASEAQADGAASTYAKRFALCNCLNITVDMDDDARLHGEKITPQQAADIERRLIAVKGNIPAFLKMAGAPNFSAIDSTRLPVLLNALEAKERLARGAPTKSHSPANPFGAADSSHEPNAVADGMNAHAAAATQPGAGTFSAPVPDNQASEAAPAQDAEHEATEDVPVTGTPPEAAPLEVDKDAWMDDNDTFREVVRDKATAAGATAADIQRIMKAWARVCGCGWSATTRDQRREFAAMLDGRTGLWGFLDKPTARTAEWVVDHLAAAGKMSMDAAAKVMRLKLPKPWTQLTIQQQQDFVRRIDAGEFTA